MTATDARSLAHDLLQRDDASLVALLVARGVSPSVTWSDAFDAAEALLDPASAERAACARCCALMMRDAAMSSMARVIFFIDSVDLIRARYSRSDTAIVSPASA